MKFHNKYKVFLIFICSGLVFTGCTKLVQADPPVLFTSGETVYTTNENAIAVVNGIYANMSSNGLTTGGTMNSFMTFFPGLSSDEFTLFDRVRSGTFSAYYHNDLLFSTDINVWLNTYPFIYRINAVIEGVSGSRTLTNAVKNEVLGEAKFLRAFNYFYLVNLYGPVPLALTTDYRVNSLLFRAPVEQVYQQIIKDLLDATTLLNSHFVGADGISAVQDRVVPNLWTAKALLARAYLYTKDYSKALATSTEILDNTSLFELSDIDAVFLKNSKEALWQLQPVNIGWNTEDARLFIISSMGPGDDQAVHLSKSLLNAFEANDKRKSHWINSVTVDGETYNFPYKYKSAKINDPVTEYQMIMRLAEQYFIRAEANAQLNNLSAAIADLNVIRRRAGLGNYMGEENKNAVLSAILKERRLELFAELGHRWLDLKRTQTVNEVMSAAAVIKGGSWSVTDQLYPIASGELQLDPNLVQNEGY